MDAGTGLSRTADEPAFYKASTYHTITYYLVSTAGKNSRFSPTFLPSPPLHLCRGRSKLTSNNFQSKN